MYFPRINVYKDQLDMMIGAISLEYTYKNVSELASLISNNFDIPYNDILVSLNAHEAYKGEDFETLSNKTIAYAN